MVDQSLSFDKFKDTPLAKIAEELGYLCLSWSWLDSSINSMLRALIDSPDEETSAAIANNMDMRNSCRAILALGFLKKPTDAWYSELQKLVNEIDNDLRVERNRMVHDSWHNTGEEAFRLTTYAKISKVQARESALHFGEGKIVSPGQIRALCFRIFAAGGHLADLLDRYAEPSPDKDA
jgi:hypothetical protein